MILKNTNKIMISIICLCVLALTFSCLSLPKVQAANGIELEDGRYELEFETSMPAMGMGAFENKAKKVILEKVGKKYYLTVSTNISEVSDVSLVMRDGKPGETVVIDGNIERHTYSMLEKHVGKEIELSMYVKAMQRVSYPKIKPLLNTAKRLGDVDTTVDRPAEFVPVITTKASNNELEKGSDYIIPEATAKIGNQSLTVLIEAYYLNKGEKVALDVTSGVINLNKVGEYHIVYHAESDKYKTLKGGNTITEIDVKLIVRIGATSIVKIEDKDKILPANYSLQSNMLTSGDTFDKAKNSMKKIADNFEVISWDILDKEGNIVAPEKNINVFLRCNDSYNKNKVNVFQMSEDGSLKKINADNYGRYVKINTKNTGTYIICQPGVAFHMPMWGYAIIFATTFVTIVVIIIVAIVLIKSKKKRIAKK